MFGWLEGSRPFPIALYQSRVVTRFGAQAIFGGLISAVDALGILEAERVERAWHTWKNYRDKNGNENWVEWSEKYPGDAKLIAEYLNGE